MTEITVKMRVCSACREFHELYMQGVQFKNGRKEAITECRLCEQAMCDDCLKGSQKELQDDPLALYGLVLCQRCIMDAWRLTTWHKAYEAIALKGLETFKKGMRKEIYMLTQAKR